MTKRNAAILAVCLGWMTPSLAIATAQQPDAIHLSDLPPPPESIEKLLELGQVRFTAGERKDESKESGSRRLSAETSYQVKYDYRSRSQWRVQGAGPQRRLVITVRFTNVSVKPTHEVWFRRPPRRSDFWQQKLVLHELDHVKISSDARLARRFEQLLQDQNVIETAMAAGTRADSRLVNRLIDQHVKRVFDEVLALVAIRYRELDRVTDHGLRPLPEHSSLNEILRQRGSEP